SADTGPRGPRRHATAATDPTTTSSRSVIAMNNPAGGPPRFGSGPGPVAPAPKSRSLGRAASDPLLDGFGVPLATGEPTGSSANAPWLGPPVGSKSIHPYPGK